VEQDRIVQKETQTLATEGNNEMCESYSDYTMEADYFYSQNSVSDIIAARLKMLLLSFENYYPEHEDPGGKICGL